MRAAQRGMATKTEPHEALRLGDLFGRRWLQGNDPEIDGYSKGELLAANAATSSTRAGGPA